MYNRFQQDFLRAAIRQSGRTLQRVYQHIASVRGSRALPPGAAWLWENRSHVMAQVKDVTEALSKKYSRSLASAHGSAAQDLLPDHPPEIYRIVAGRLENYSGPLT